MRKLLGAGMAIMALSACDAADTAQTATTTTTTTTTSSSTGSGGAGGQAGGSSTAGSGGASTAPLAPTLESVMAMAGGLHVVWTNNTANCDTIALERNEDGGPFQNLETFVVPNAEALHDATASNAAVAYCYKLRCSIGELVSPDSNELCGSP
ncbi:MAG: hypothetical protein HY908_09385 [Myxococcales bacterium]|nr:hypothetical protein [Myxococcales bacterium]